MKLEDLHPPYDKYEMAYPVLIFRRRTGCLEGYFSVEDTAATIEEATKLYTTKEITVIRLIYTLPEMNKWRFK